MTGQRTGAGRSRRWVWPAVGGVVALLLFAAFLMVVRIDATTGPGTDTRGMSGEPVSQLQASPVEDVPSALDNPANPDLPAPAVDLAEIQAVLRPDGIPAIDEPRFQDATSVDWLDPREPVIGVTVGEETRGYPIQVLTFHEIVNDTIADVPVAVTYCPLCNSSLTFDRRVGDRVLDFGVSGMLRNNNLVMYDRQTESLWQQAESQAIAGTLVGTELDRFSSPILAWGDFRDAHPEALVLTRDTGADRAYGINPYEGYDRNGFVSASDGRLGAMTRVAGLGSGTAEPVAVVVEWLLGEGGSAQVDVAGDPVSLWVVGDTASALDTADITEGRTIGSVVAYDPRVAGRDLTFAVRGSGVVDDQTGSRWDATGTAVAGPLTGTSLSPVIVDDTFWFAWSGFEDDTTIVGSPRE